MSAQNSFLGLVLQMESSWVAEWAVVMNVQFTLTPEAAYKLINKYRALLKIKTEHHKI